MLIFFLNITSILNRQLKKQCLGKTDIPITMTTPLKNPTTEKIELTATDKNGLPAEDTTPLQKIFEYLEYLHKEEKRKALESKDNTKKFKLGQEPFSFLSSPSFSGRIQGMNVEDPSTEPPLPKTTTSTKKDYEKNKIEKNINSELETLMNVLRTNIGRTLDLSHQGSTTVKTVKDLSVSEHTKDIDYITKIVEEIMSKRQLKEVNTTKGPNLNTNETMQNVDQMLDVLSKNKSISLINYYLNNCKLGNFYENNQGDKEKLDTFDNIKRLRSSINEPEAKNNDEYFICNRFKPPEQKVVPGQNDNPIISNILSELKKESQRFKLLDKESAIGSIMKHQPQTAQINQINNNVKIINKEGLNIVNKESIRALGNQSQSISFDDLRDHMKISDVYKDGLEVSDSETDKALKIVLQSQSQLFNQIFNQQRNLIKMYNNDKEKLKPPENEITKPLQSAYKAQTNNEVLDDQNEPVVTIQRPQEEYPTKINENIHKIESILGHEQAETTGHSPSFHYRPSKSDNNIINEEYKRWLLMAPNSFVIGDQATEPKHNVRTRNRMDDTLKITNTLNSIVLDPNFVKEYKRPWFFAELSNKHFKLKINGNQQGLLFTPNIDSKITNTVKPILQNAYEKSWSPYFDTADNNTAVIRTNENLRTNKKQPSIVVDSDYPSLIQSKVRELTDKSKKYPMIDGTYENKYPSVIEDRRSSEQLETKQDKKINKFNCQSIHETRVECLSAIEYKSNWGHFRNKQNNIKITNMRENNEETETFNNNIRTKNNNYRLPSRPTITDQHLDSDTTLDQFKTNIDDDDLISQNETKESKNPPSFPPNVIKDIAQSIKEFVLRDLKTTMTTTTIAPSSTTTSQMTTITPTTITKIVKSRTTEEMPTTSTIDPLKIQDASKTLEKMMEMFAKITLMKDTVLEPEHVPYNRDTTVTTQKTTTQHHEQSIVPTDNTLRHQQNIQLEENRVPLVSQPLQQNVDNLKAYVPQLVERKIENLLPYGLQPLQRDPENHVPYVTQILQRNPENRLAYDSQTLNLNPNHHVLYDTQPLHQVNRVPYEIQTSKGNLENPEISEQYVSQAVQLKTGKRLQYYPYSLERNPEKRVYVPQAPVNYTPYVPKVAQLKIENPTYVPQAVPQKAESRFPFDSQLLQNNQENPQHDTLYLQRNPGDRIPVPDFKTESRIRYFPLALQSKTENRIPYDQQLLQPNSGIPVTYRPAPFKYLPHAAELPLGNSIPYGSRVVQPVKTENYLPYNPKPNGSKNRPYDYSMMDPYHHSKMEYDAPEAPVPQNKVKPSSGKEVITVQTNSGEISPLKIVLQKPFLQNIVLTTKSPVKVHHSDETFNFRKPIQKQNRHQVQVKESEMSNINEDKGYVPRHVTHKDTKIAAPKSRKTKKEREVIQHYKPRDLNEIEKFHEKLEGGDTWHREDEKIAKRVQRPIVKNTNYDDTHFRNFLQTQQKVNAMLEKILASGKTKPISAEVI
ncbi:uncharacterized protein LOC133528399 isoform X2 [Cydia pomonella]|uniref:uncharacterized protein LOC133528399 isoform X2 n=1 Tax=Cydia pomonella TaxID=82600 RepID=UPI002ADE5DE3|nr:uncharacterized protein LOC133528399 isoform X2 [Cydia pomonella]